MKRKLVVLSALVGLVSASVWAGCGSCPGDAKKEGVAAPEAKAACAVKDKAACTDKDKAACGAAESKAAVGGKAGCKGCPVKAAGGVDTESLAALVDAKTPLTILDARSGKYDDGKRIPGAKALSPTAEQAEIEKALPDKKARIVTYCAGVTCPASGQLSARLKSLGYVDVQEYHEGIAGWTKAGKPVENAK